MKRLCLILAYLFLFTQTATAMPLLVGQKVVYRGTITGLRISAVDGTAFIDNAGATIPTYADGNHQIEIYDSSNRMLKGVLKAAGTSETLGSELFKDSGFDDAAAWSLGAAPSAFEVSGSKLNGVEGTKGYAAINAYPNNALVGALYKTSFDIEVATAGSVRIELWQEVWKGIHRSTTGTHTEYATGVVSNRAFQVSNISRAFRGQIDNASAKQVTAPSSSGATIVSAKGGTTYNFSYKNDSFTYNAASYYVIIRAIR